MNSAVGVTHVIAAQMDERFELEAGCFSRNSEINRITGSKWNIENNRIYSSFDQMLDSEQGRLDAIAIVTPTPSHQEQILKGHSAGFRVICEKALTVSSRDAHILVDACRNQFKYLAVTYNYSGYPLIRELRNLILAGRLGRIRKIHIEMPQEGYGRVDSHGQPVIPQQWRLIDGVIPTIYLDLGVHMHHLVWFLTGERPLRAIATENTHGHFRSVIDNVESIVEYTSEMTVSYWFSKSSLGHRNGLRVRVYGELASSEWYQMEPEYLVMNERCGRSSRLDRASPTSTEAMRPRYNRFKVGHPSGFIEAFSNIYWDIADSIETRDLSPDAFSAERATEGLRLFEAMRRSSQTGHWANVC